MNFAIKSSNSVDSANKGHLAVQNPAKVKEQVQEHLQGIRKTLGPDWQKYIQIGMLPHVVPGFQDSVEQVIHKIKNSFDKPQTPRCKCPHNEAKPLPYKPGTQDQPKPLPHHPQNRLKPMLLGAGLGAISPIPGGILLGATAGAAYSDEVNALLEKMQAYTANVLEK